MRTTSLAIGVGIISIGLAGCGGGTKAADTTTIINQTVMPSSPSATAPAAASASPSASGTGAPSAAPQAAGSLPQPPGGATQIETGTKGDVAKAKYSINDQLPDQVTEYYTNRAARTPAARAALPQRRPRAASSRESRPTPTPVNRLTSTSVRVRTKRQFATVSTDPVRPAYRRR